MIDSSDPDELLDERDAAALLSVSMRTLQAWRTKRRGPPYVKMQRLVRYRRGTLREWVTAKTELSK